MCTSQGTLSLVSPEAEVRPSTAGSSTMPSGTQRSPTDFSLRVPKNWKETMAKADQQWIGHTVFSAKNRISESAAATMWWYPPTREVSPSSQPQPDMYHLRQLFLWMPRRVWGVDFKCPHCGPHRSLQ